MQALLRSLHFSPCVVSLRGNLAHLQVAEVRRHSTSHGKRRNSVGVCVPPAATKKGSETLAVLLKDLPEKIVQKTVLEKEPAPATGTKWKAGKVRRQLVIVVVIVALLQKNSLQQGELGSWVCRIRRQGGRGGGVKSGGL